MNQPANDPTSATAADKKTAAHPPAPPESGGPKGPEPTRYGDWEIKGKCVDF